MMPCSRFGFLAVAGVVVAAACAPSPNPAPSATAARPDSALRAELLARRARDQDVRRQAIAQGTTRGVAADSGLVASMAAVDSANTAWLEDVVARVGWPTPALVGADGVDAAFILVQHATGDTAFQARVLPLLSRAYARGEATGQQVALLSDRMAVARGQHQLYGTQAKIAGGHVTLDPIADSAHVDARRAKLGLPPLAEYVRMLQALYTGHM